MAPAILRSSWSRLAVVAPSSLLAESLVQALTLQPGDIVAQGASGGLFQIDPWSGAKSQITASSFDDFAVGVGGRLYGLPSGAVHEIDPATGTSTPISSGGLLVNPMAISVSPAGHIYVFDHAAGQGRLLGIDPADGAQSLVSEAGMLSSGTGSGSFADITLSPDGGQVIVREDWETVLGVDVSSGAQSVLAVSDLGLDGGIGVGPDGTIYPVSWSFCMCVGRLDAAEGDADWAFAMRRQDNRSLLLPRDAAVTLDGRLLVTGVIFGFGDTEHFPDPFSSAAPLLVVDLPAPVFDPFSDRIRELATELGGEVQVVPLPEPGTAALLALGLCMLGRMSNRSRHS